VPILWAPCAMAGTYQEMEIIIRQRHPLQVGYRSSLQLLRHLARPNHRLATHTVELARVPHALSRTLLRLAPRGRATQARTRPRKSPDPRLHLLLGLVGRRGRCRDARAESAGKCRDGGAWRCYSPSSMIANAVTTSETGSGTL
jgi:hypothetical protein